MNDEIDTPSYPMFRPTDPIDPVRTMEIQCCGVDFASSDGAATLWGKWHDGQFYVTHEDEALPPTPPTP